MFRYNLLPALPGSFTCHCGNTGVERTPNKSQHTKLTPEKNILPPFLPGFELATFRSRVRRSSNRYRTSVKGQFAFVNTEGKKKQLYLCLPLYLTYKDCGDQNFRSYLYLLLSQAIRKPRRPISSDVANSEPEKTSGSKTGTSHPVVVVIGQAKPVDLICVSY